MRKYFYTQEQIENIVKLYKSGWGCVEISRKIGLGTQGSILQILRSQGVERRKDFGRRPQRSIPVSKETREMIDGMMLGDGHLLRIRPPSINSGFSTCLSSKQDGFIDWIGSFFERDGIRFSKYSKKNSWPNTYATILSTRKLKEFTLIRNRWYPDGDKIIPLDLELTPIVCLAWYMSDGTRHKQGGFTIATNGFTFSDANILVNKLIEIGISSKIRTHNSRGQGFSKVSVDRPVLYIPRKESFRFSEFMGDCPVPSLSYKWPD